MGLLDTLYSRIDAAKRFGGGLLSNPVDTAAQLWAQSLENPREKGLLAMERLAAKDYEGVLDAAVQMTAPSAFKLPKILYHGSQVKGLGALTLEKYGATNPGLFGKGVYLSESKPYATGYATGQYGRPAGELLHVEHGINNPFYWPNSVSKELGLAGKVAGKNADDIAASVKAAGHDSIVVLAKNPSGVYAQEVVSLNPSTLKILGRE